MSLKSHFLSFYPDHHESARVCFNSLYDALNELGIVSPMTMIGALATVRVEVGRDFKPKREIHDGSNYEGRVTLGNTEPGDGPKYRGAGYTQLTGRWNYTHYSKLTGLDLVNNPELLLIPENSAKVLAHYFKERGIHNYCNDRNWRQVRLKVNGGLNGYEQFMRVVNAYLLFRYGK